MRINNQDNIRKGGYLLVVFTALCLPALIKHAEVCIVIGAKPGRYPYASDYSVTGGVFTAGRYADRRTVRMRPMRVAVMFVSRDH